jgi:hypothetical protein
MRNSRMLIALGCAVVLSAACASKGAPGTGPTVSRYVVTEQDLTPVAERSAYEALQQIRPTFLRSRDPQTPTHMPTPVAVFVDGGRTEGLDVLRSIRANRVKEMRFYEPQDANTKFGTGHNGGVIEVSLK